ncbi:hypothetical protein [Mesomycoplasma ovipneumoniae]|uniref:hypothetical protein n=1 Tax=Mesomycoplasma ovipneumoniae TaxID=29562 RepID=UPI0026E3CAB7|nr:hypothetical protein [Mesomycoplasma ovipneumoniae]MDO6856742.1 hypothetical protein [Mesomycoplasma ovipneumoniae]
MTEIHPKTKKITSNNSNNKEIPKSLIDVLEKILNNSDQNSLKNNEVIKKNKNDLKNSQILENLDNKFLDLDYESALKNPKFASWIKQLKIDKNEYYDNLDLFWRATEWEKLPNYKFEMIREPQTRKLKEKCVFLWSEDNKKWAEFLLLPEISFPKFKDFFKIMEQLNVGKFGQILPLLEKFKIYLNKNKMSESLVYWTNWDSVSQTLLLKSFTVFFALRKINVGYFNLSEICQFITENKAKLTKKLKNVDVLIVELDIISNFTTWFLAELEKVIAERIITNKLTIISFDSDFYNKSGNQKIANLIKYHGINGFDWLNENN